MLVAAKFVCVRSSLKDLCVQLLGKIIYQAGDTLQIFTGRFERIAAFTHMHWTAIDVVTALDEYSRVVDSRDVSPRSRARHRVLGFGRAARAHCDLDCSPTGCSLFN